MNHQIKLIHWLRFALSITLLMGLRPIYAADTDKDGVFDALDPAPADIRVTGYQPPWIDTFKGYRVDDAFGSSVSGAGDVNNDGYTDVVVGASRDDNNDTDSGSARIFSGATGDILYTFNGDSLNDNFGSSVSAAGDVNNDGYADVVVGATRDDNNGTDSGSARIFSGATGAILYTFNGDSLNDNFGSSVGAAGDVDNDGYADVVVGASRDDNNGADSGSARIFSGANGAILYTFSGDSAGDYFGFSVSGAGDVNNDGYADVIVGAYGDDNNGTDSGSSRIFSGATGTILYNFNGDSANDRFGKSSGVGDVNNDGYADVVVGASGNDNNGTDSGSARIFSGANGAILYTFNGDSLDDNFGSSVGGAGDVNNDGYVDVVVGAFTDDNNGSDSGSVRIFSGANGAILYTFNGDGASDYFGFSVSGAGDVNNDGYADVVVGALSGVIHNGILYGNSGSARIFSGALFLQQTTDTDVDGLVNTLDTDDDADGMLDVWEFTYGLNPLVDEAAADLDGDGLSNLQEFLSGLNPTSSETDRDGVPDAVDPAPTDISVSGYHWPWLNTFNGDSLGDQFGVSVSSVGDVNNDGYADVVVGAHGDDNNGGESGSARILSGENGTILYTFSGDSAGDLFGLSVSGAGDVNHDGYADVIVGAYGDDNNGDNSGSARVFSGANGAILYTFNGNSAGDYFGYSVSGAGDVNNDGYADVVVGAYADDNAGSYSGSVSIFSGVDGSILYTFTGDSNDDRFGYSVSDAGDVNNDGYADVVVGAYYDDNTSFDSGSARVFSGANGAILYTFNGDSGIDWFGYSVSGAGDVNNDG